MEVELSIRATQVIGHMLKSLLIKLDIILSRSISIRDSVKLFKNVRLINLNMKFDIQGWNNFVLVTGFKRSHEVLEDGADALDNAVFDHSIRVVFFQFAFKNRNDLSEIWRL